MAETLEIQKPLSSDRQVVKIGDDSTGLLLRDKDVLVEGDLTIYGDVQSATVSAGTILGYTDIGLNETRVSLNLTTSYVVPTDEFSVSFIVPPSRKVEIMMQITFNAGSGGTGDLYAGLSTQNATDTYSSLADWYEEELVDQSGRYGRDVIQNYWTISDLIAGNNVEYWVGFKSSSTLGTPTIEWGGSSAGHNPDFIMKATALPSEITT